MACLVRNDVYSACGVIGAASFDLKTLTDYAHGNGFQDDLCRLNNEFSRTSKKPVFQLKTLSAKQLMRPTALFGTEANPHEFRGSACANAQRLAIFLEKERAKQSQTGRNQA